MPAGVQVFDFAFPSGHGEPIAVVKLRAEALAQALGFSVERWEEYGMGPAVGFAVRAPSGRVYFFRELEHSLTLGARGPSVDVDQAAAGAATLRESLDEMLVITGLAASDLDWIRSETTN